MANLCHFNVLFTRNVPHILEKIFLSLDYESYESAGNVSTVWYNLLTSKNYQRKAKIVHIELHKNFDGWSLAMIKDFIFCMDAAREKLCMAGLKDNKARVNRRGLFRLLLDEWKELYPETEATEPMLVAKIIYLREQRDNIKKDLKQSSSVGMRHDSSLVPKIHPRRSRRLLRKRKMKETL